MRLSHSVMGMLEQLRMFLVALEEGSLNRAASRMRMSQSALSRQMQNLETAIGGALLERTTTGVRATAAGHALAASLPGVLSQVDTAVAEARRLARGQRDLLRVGYLGSATQAFFNPSLADLRRSHPEVKVKLLDLSPGEQIAALRKGEIDLAVTGQEGALASREFYTRKLATMSVVAVLPDDHPLSRRKKIPLSALREERFVSAPEEDMPGRDRWVVQLCRRVGFRPRFMQRGESINEMFSLVSGEGMVALAPGYLTSLSTAGVVMVPLSDAWATWDFLIVWQRGRTSDSLQALLNALASTVDQVCETARRAAGG